MRPTPSLSGVPAAAEGRPLIEVENLRTWFPVREGLLTTLIGGGERRHVKAVDGVSFSLRPGEVLGVAGESGCGKSTMGTTLAHLTTPSAGTIRFEGRDMSQLRGRAQMKAFRRNVQIVFQNPFESLNPSFTIRDSVREPVSIHFPGDRALQAEKVLLAMRRAGLTPPETFLDRFPHQLSGGQLQRVAIARAIAVEPKLLIADEPVSMLDVSIRAGILNLFRGFARELGMSIVYISHDLSTMKHICDRVAVMYLGRIVEIGATEEVLRRPQHPYTRALIAAVPLMGGKARKRMHLEGAPPNPIDVPAGCRFHPRCPQAFEGCDREDPAAAPGSGGRLVACRLPQADIHTQEECYDPHHISVARSPAARPAG